MKGKLKGLIVSVAAVLLSLPCAVAPVFANSGPRYEEGVTSSGAVVRGDKSALKVESEKLTFDVVSKYGEYIDSARFTAEYTFTNTSQNTVRTSMAFPVDGSFNDYDDEYRAEIKVDGKETEYEKRVTYGKYTDFGEAVKKLDADWYEDDFYRPDMPVYIYRTSVDLTNSKYDEVYLMGEASFDNTKAGIITGGSSGGLSFCFKKGDGEGGDKTEFSAQTTDGSSGEAKVPYKFCYFVLGDESAIKFKWKTQVFKETFWDYYDLRDYDAPYKIEKTGETTLKELILSARPATCEYGERDFYNYVCEKIATDAYNVPGYSGFGVYDYNSTVWYTYDVEVAAGGRIVNTVSAPFMFSAADYTYSPPVYSYKYYLSPASRWAGFGKLEVEINTEFHFLDVPENFVKTENGYKATFDSLPESELTLKLCREASPSKSIGRGTPILIVAIVIGLMVFAMLTAGFVLLIVYLVKDKKKIS